MKGIISIFVMPQEIDDLALTLERLKRNSAFIDNSVQYKVDLTMSLSDELTNWENSKLPKEYFTQRATELCEKYLDWCEWNILTDSEEVLGCVSQRRYSWKNNTDADFFIWLDTDMFFKDTTLFYMQEVYKTILATNGPDMFVITPEFVKQWDDTWDVISNSNYSHISHKDYNKIDVYKYEINNNIWSFIKDGVKELGLNIC